MMAIALRCELCIGFDRILIVSLSCNDTDLLLLNVDRK
jgi:hypothetical protein